MTLPKMTQPYAATPRQEFTTTGRWIVGRTRSELLSALLHVPAPSAYPAVELHNRVLVLDTQRLTADDCRAIVAAATHCLSLSELPGGTTHVGMQVLRAMGLAGLQRIREARGAVMN